MAKLGRFFPPFPCPFLAPRSLQALQTEIQSLKDHVQELHRDLTKHHSLIRTEIMAEVLQKSLQVDVQIASEYSTVEMKRTEFEEVSRSANLLQQKSAWVCLSLLMEGKKAS